MMFKKKIQYLTIFILLACIGCSRCGSSTPTVVGPLAISFVAVGDAFPAKDLIDLEFLPGQNGELIVIRQSGTVHYLKSNFSLISQTATISVQEGGEQGLLNIAADPDYATNHFVYFYYTAPGGAQNQVDRFTVSVDTDAGTFSLSDQQTIITFSKSGSSNPGSNHNGGGLIFDDSGNLLMGVGDGGSSASSDVSEGISQNLNLRLGKILRIVPSRTANAGGFTLPSGGNNEPSGALPEIYAYGLRNPFTLALGNNSLFVGDVGLGTYEEIDVVTAGGQNFGWPDTEGPTTNPNFVSPLHGYAHNDDTFEDEDPEAVFTAMISIMVLNFYTGNQYDGRLNDRLIYSEFFVGWVRGLKLDSNNNIVSDDHLGHLTGMTSLQEAPDGFLYGVSLFGSDQILRLDMNP